MTTKIYKNDSHNVVAYGSYAMRVIFYKLICKRHIIVVFVDFLPNAGVFIHHRVYPCLLVKLSVGIDRLSDIYGIFLNGEAILAYNIRVTHGYEAGKHRNLASQRNTESSAF